jgi:cytoskeletal protein CcmA (bactofilin family)
VKGLNSARAVCNQAVGVWGESTVWDGVYGFSHSANHAGVSANNDAGGYGLYAKGTTAGYFDGNVNVTGALTVHGPFDGNVNVTGALTVHGPINHFSDYSTTGTIATTGAVHATDVMLGGADCAEEFDVGTAIEIEPGTVMVLGNSGTLQPSEHAYDKKVAGVISGAGDYRPGLILDRANSSQKRMPVALVGKVYCKVDAQYAPIEVGDLLTTSSTLGHAMKADDPVRAFGAVIGKALQGMPAGQVGIIPILVSLQ